MRTPYLAFAMLPILITGASASEMDRSDVQRYLENEYSPHDGIVSSACLQRSNNPPGEHEVHLLLPRAWTHGFIVLFDKDPNDRTVRAISVAELKVRDGNIDVIEANSGGPGFYSELETTAGFLLKQPMRYDAAFHAAIYRRPTTRCPDEQ